jgi:hypothetical protein
VSKLLESREPEKYGWQADSGKPSYLPSPEEIRAQCEAIQARWSEDERDKRRSATPFDDGTPEQGSDPIETSAVTIGAA